jgi:hypothetical protein
MGNMDKNENKTEEKQKYMERVKNRIESVRVIGSVKVVGGATRTTFHCVEKGG